MIERMNYESSQMPEVYWTPECLVLALEGREICQTSLSGGEIQPGTGENWGTF